MDRLELYQARGQATGSITKRLQKDLCYGHVARRAPMTVGKKMNRVRGQRVVEINAGVRKFAEDRRGKAELRSEEIAGTLMGQDYFHARGTSSRIRPRMKRMISID